MSKAEERALEAYPKDVEEYVNVNGVKSVVDNNSWQRTIFLKGYHQAEKDLHKSIYKAGVLDGFEEAVEGQYEKGYEQAEKDLELTWEDVREMCKQSVLVEIDLGRLVSDERHYTEVLKRFKERKENYSTKY